MVSGTFGLDLKQFFLDQIEFTEDQIKELQEELKNPELSKNKKSVIRGKIEDLEKRKKILEDKIKEGNENKYGKSE